MHEPRHADGDRRTFEILGAAMAVHRTLGCGSLETIYREALGIEFSLRQIPFEREVPYQVHYKGHRLSGSCRIDFLCFDTVIVEIKARSATGPADAAQVLNYLASSGHQIALLLNFGTARLDYRRYILTNRASPKPTT